MLAKILKRLATRGKQPAGRTKKNEPAGCCDHMGHALFVRRDRQGDWYFCRRCDELVKP